VSTEEARLEVIALAGLPEVRPGDDLERMIGDAKKQKKNKKKTKKKEPSDQERNQ